MLTTDLILKAYSIGVFPMAESVDAKDVFWCDPDFRGLIPLDHHFHCPKRLRPAVKKLSPYHIKIDHDFDAVIRACAGEGVKGRDESWINPLINDTYKKLFDQGHVHTIELWRDDNLVAGLYGLHIGAAFFGEAMFSREKNTSKIVLVHLAARLHHAGFKIFDTQYLTPHLEQFGAFEVPRDVYQILLSDALRSDEAEINFPYSAESLGFSSDAALVSSFLQPVTQIS